MLGISSSMQGKANPACMVMHVAMLESTHFHNNRGMKTSTDTTHLLRRLLIRPLRTVNGKNAQYECNAKRLKLVGQA